MFRKVITTAFIYYYTRTFVRPTEPVKNRACGRRQTTLGIRFAHLLIRR